MRGVWRRFCFSRSDEVDIDSQDIVSDVEVFLPAQTRNFRKARDGNRRLIDTPLRVVSSGP